MKAYYNEIDPRAAAWLRELIKEGHIAPGYVDERSIEDVRPSELVGYTQCHFFAGIGGWSLALRLAGWPDDKPVWTGSCPCQPFSAAGKGAGFADERHLWPAFYWLIQQSRPAVIFGEQVASPAGLAWYDTVSTDLEAENYTVGQADICAAGVGAPHIRQRLYWVGHSSSSRGGRDSGALSGEKGSVGREVRRKSHVSEPASEFGSASGLADTKHTERRPLGLDRENGCDRTNSGRQETHGITGARSEVRGVADSSSSGLEVLGEQQARGQRETSERSSPPWDTCEWIQCRDGKARPIEPGTFPLAHGVPGRVGLLRGYGNAIVPQLAAEFIKATELA